MCATKWGGIAAFLTLLIAAAAPAWGQGSEPELPVTSDTIQASVIFERVVAGVPISLSNVKVEGDLNLRSHGRVASLFRCTACVFAGFSAGDVTFDRTFDLSGSALTGAADLKAAVFKERVILDQVKFLSDATFASARFLADAYFSGTTFGGTASFERAHMTETAAFNQAEFQRTAIFNGAQFVANASFARAEFADQSSFQSATFGGPLNFVLAVVKGKIEFHGAEFRSRANFSYTEFVAGFDLEGASAANIMDFQGSKLSGEADFLRFTSSGSVVMKDMRMHEGAVLRMSDWAAAALILEPETATRYVQIPPGNPKNRIDVLKKIEETARERKDLARANDAQYELTKLQSRRTTLREALLDYVYREAMGYLVRPENPMKAILVLVLLAGLVRALVEPATLLIWRIAEIRERRNAGDPSLNSGRPGAVAKGRPWGAGQLLDSTRRNLGISFGLAVAPSFTAKGSADVPGLRTLTALLALFTLIFCSGFRAFKVRFGSGLLRFEKGLTALLRGVTESARVAVTRKPGIQIADRNSVGSYFAATVQWSEYLGYKCLTAVFLLALGRSNATVSQLLNAVIS